MLPIRLPYPFAPEAQAESSVTSDLPLAWAVQNAAQADLALTYEVQTSAQVDLALAYAIRGRLPVLSISTFVPGSLGSAGWRPRVTANWA